MRIWSTSNGGFFRRPSSTARRAGFTPARGSIRTGPATGRPGSFSPPRWISPQAIWLINCSVSRVSPTTRARGYRRSYSAASSASSGPPWRWSMVPSSSASARLPRQRQTRADGSSPSIRRRGQSARSGVPLAGEAAAASGCPAEVRPSKATAPFGW